MTDFAATAIRPAINKAVDAPPAPHCFYPLNMGRLDAQEIMARRLFRPRHNADAVSLPNPMDWRGEAYGADRNMRMLIQGFGMLRGLVGAFDDYADKAEIAEYFMGFFRDWLAAHEGEAPVMQESRMPSDYSRYDMAVGFRAATLAFFLSRARFFGIALSDGDHAALGALTDWHIAYLTNENNISDNNHGIYELHGLMALAKAAATPDNPRDAEAQFALRQMEKLIRSQFDDHGIHKEHSPSYHFMATDKFDEAVSSGWYAGSEVIPARILQAKAQFAWLLDPAGKHICVGDSAGRRPGFPLAPRGGEKTGLIVPPTSASGYFIARSCENTPLAEASMACLFGAYHSKTHKHRDCLSLEWFDKGKKIICDSGKYGYFSDKYRMYFLSARAHNSVEAEGFDTLKQTPYGVAQGGAEILAPDICALRAEISFPSFSHARHVYMRAGKWLIVLDDAEYAEKTALTQWFHLDRHYLPVSISGERLAFRHAESGDALIARRLAEGEARLHIGDESLMQGFISETGGEYAPAPAVGFTAQAARASFATIWAFSERDEEDATEFIAAHGNAPPPAAKNNAQGMKARLSSLLNFTV